MGAEVEGSTSEPGHLLFGDEISQVLAPGLGEGRGRAELVPRGRAFNKSRSCLWTCTRAVPSTWHTVPYHSLPCDSNLKTRFRSSLLREASPEGPCWGRVILWSFRTLSQLLSPPLDLGPCGDGPPPHFFQEHRKH